MNVSPVYDAVAATYARLLPDFSFEADEDIAVLQTFISELHYSESPILDAGCGAGRLIPLLTNAGLKPLGCDLSPGMIEQARAKYPNTDFCVSDLRELPFEDHYFSGIISWYSLIHFSGSDLCQALEEFMRVLVPGGEILLAFQAGEGERFIENAYGSGLTMNAYLHEPSTMADLLENLGFTITKTFKRDPRPGEPYPQGFVSAVLP